MDTGKRCYYKYSIWSNNYQYLWTYKWHWPWR